jgi:hypothetical protein
VHSHHTSSRNTNATQHTLVHTSSHSSSMSASPYKASSPFKRSHGNVTSESVSKEELLRDLTRKFDQQCHTLRFKKTTNVLCVFTVQPMLRARTR